MKMIKYFLGIDGGGTKTAFMLCGRNGEKVSECTLEGCNPIDIGMERAKEILTRGIQTVCADVEHSEISAYAGIAGGITGNNREVLRSFLESFGFADVSNNSDAMNAVAAGLQGRDGVAVIMGTGCVAFTKIGRDYFRTGGFGYLIDAGGDGYSIGRDALRYALYAEQRNKPRKLLLELLQEKAGGSITDRLGEIYAGGKAYIASFCPIVFQAFRAGDCAADKILQDNMECVLELILEAAEKLKTNESVYVALLGGVAKQPETVRLIKDAILKKNIEDHFDFSVPDVEPVIGAIQLAREEVSC